MSNIDHLTIGEARQLASMFPNVTPVEVPTGQFIAVLDRGFVYAGQLQPGAPGWAKMTDAKNIRYWGTSKGLGELINGPLSGTKVDAVGEILIPLKSIMHLIPCKGF
jgi:hypothetical protein